MNHVYDTPRLPAKATITEMEVSIDGFNQLVTVEYYSAHGDFDYQNTIEFAWLGDPNLAAAILIVSEVTKPLVDNEIEQDRSPVSWSLSFKWAKEHEQEIDELEITDIRVVESFGENETGTGDLEVKYPNSAQKDSLLTLVTLLGGRGYTPLSRVRELKCSTCVGSCCTKYASINVLDADLPRLMRATDCRNVAALKQRGILIGASGFGIAGQIGRTKTGKISDEALSTTCVFQSWTAEGVGRCTIYEDRPTICRMYTESDCQIHVKAGDCETNALTCGPLYQIRPNKDYAPRDRQNPKRFDWDKHEISNFTEEG